MHLQRFNFRMQAYINATFSEQKDLFQIYQNCDLGDIIVIKVFYLKPKTQKLTIKAFGIYSSYQIPKTFT
ncbi:hypothetical protein ACEW7V_01245 [Areca yellow leaf disease phytoplasma]|uniref:hypothetical protein n=1 Tax=Areca yellow leaf disease phytoplasma TaxID=927614 RepID=UPI0035B54E5A